MVQSNNADDSVQLECATCPKSYHKTCYKHAVGQPSNQSTAPSGKISCKECSRPAATSCDADKKQQQSFCSSCKRVCTYAAVECSLCQDVRHLECLKVPLKFLFAGGSQAGAHEGDFEFGQSMGYKLISAKVEGSGITARQIVEESLG